MAVPSDEVSSKAVVKYELNPVLTSYKQLEQFTDLNMPPSNWLKDNLAGRFADSFKRKKTAIDYTSLLMAHRYPQAIGEVDVVSGADHIKKLLKIPFSTKELSLTVHRMGKSLLLDDIDIPALLQSHANNDSINLEWLREIYGIATNAPKDSEFYPKKRNKEESELQKILSKFMHHSITSEEDKDFNSTSLMEQPVIHNNLSMQPQQQQEQALTSPSSAGISQSEFHRDILWNFEDITMLVGSDLPIFGGGKYPTVSLRLRDSMKPVNILTGIDYWLDNLMCNVPEILMCYHSKGIVQRYEKINTTDLPSMDGSSFSPKIVKDVAQNILSFLKSNCTKEGHTYWLFKSNKDDVIKLYDLTSICDQNKNISTNHNPFAMSVGMLLYKIACNMYNTNEINRNNISKVKSLLQQSIILLDKEEQHTTSFWANYLLVSLITRPIKNSESDEDDITFDDLEDDDSESTEDDSSENEKSFESCLPIKTVSVKTLCIPSNVKPRRQSAIMEDTYNKIDEDNKNKIIITKIITTLKTLNLIVKKRNSFPAILGSPQKKQTESDNIDAAIPKTSVELIKKDSLPIPFDSNINIDTNNTSSFPPVAIKIALIQKAVLAYLNLINLNISNLKFGRGLRFLKICSILLSYLDEFKSKNLLLKVKARMFFGDILTLVGKEKFNIDAEKLDFTAYNQNDLDIIEMIETYGDNQLFIMENIEGCFGKNLEELLNLAADVYELALAETGKDQDEPTAQVITDLTRRLGNIRNELGVFYMNKAASITKSFGLPTNEEIAIWKKGFTFFERAIQAFEIVNDWANVALLYSNSARLMRLCAQVYGYSTRSSLDESRRQFTQQEKTCFHKAFEFYMKALSTLESKKIKSSININISIEISGAYFTMANLMQDYAPLNSMAEENVVKEISSLLMKAMNFCELIYDKSSTEQKESLTLRLAMIHQRLASLYHHVLRNQISDHGKINYRSLSELHYKKSYQHLNPTLHYMEFFKLFVEYVALYEYLLKQGYSHKTLKSKFELFLTKENKLIESLKQVTDKLKHKNQSKDTRYERFSKKTEDEEETEEIVDVTELVKIVGLLEKQLTNTFKEILKFTSAQKSAKGIDFINKILAKQLLEIVLRGLVPTEKELSTRVVSLLTVLNNLYDIYGKNLK